MPDSYSYWQNIFHKYELANSLMQWQYFIQEQL